MSHTIELSWMSIVDFDDTIVPLNFTMKVYFESNDTAGNLINSIERIRTLEAQLTDAVFLQQDSPNIDFFLNKNVTVINLPEEPHNMMIGLAVLSKIAAITENKITIKGATIMNSMDPDLHTEIDPLNLEFLYAYCNKLGYDQWFINTLPVVSDINIQDSTPSWAEYNLEWAIDENYEVTGKMVSTWQPRIIPGGKQ